MILILAVHDASDFFVYTMGEAKMLQAVNTLKMLQSLTREKTADTDKCRVGVALIPPEYLIAFKQSKGHHLPPGGVTIGAVTLWLTARGFIAHMEEAKRQRETTQAQE